MEFNGIIFDCGLIIWCYNLLMYDYGTLVNTGIPIDNIHKSLKLSYYYRIM